MKYEQNLNSVLQWLNRHPIATIVLALLLFPMITGNFALGSFIVIFGLMAVAYNFCLGETGLLTFGHAAFFGLGAYGCGIVLVHMEIEPHLAWVGILVGVLAAAVGGFIIAALSLRRTGTYLALITLGFAQLLWFVAFQWYDVTGGDDGLVGVTTPELGIPGVFVIDFRSQLDMYFFLLAFFAISLFIMNVLRRSNFGRVLNAIRENENRAKFLGYDVYRYKLASFTISATFTGVAGTLYAIYLNIVSLATLHWLLSGEVNFWVLLGGVNSFVGPVLGAGVYYYARDTLATMTDFWQLPVGLLFIAIVLFLPEGIIPTMKEKMTERLNLSIVDRDVNKLDQLDKKPGDD